MSTTSNDDQKSFRRGRNVGLTAHDLAQRRRRRYANGNERDAWRQGMPADLFIRENG